MSTPSDDDSAKSVDLKPHELSKHQKMGCVPIFNERAAFLRARYNLKTPDAIQVATALVSGSRAFLTNDENITAIEGIDILLLDRL
jgi:predicted nucleic acid-binding protein